MTTTLFDQLQSTLAADGPDKAIETLCRQLRESGEYGPLFYALLLKKRHELGVSPIPTGPAQDFPEALHASYEEAIRDAARQVGQLFLQAGNIAQAWAYFRMIEEPEPVRQALEAYQPGEDQDIEEVIRVAFGEGVHPTH